MMLSTSTIATFTALSIAILVLTSLAHTWRVRNRRTRQLKGIEWLVCLRHLLAHLQQHRGLTSAFLAGKTELKGDISSLHTQIRRDCEAVILIGEWITHSPRWQGIEEHWQRLAQRFQTLDRDTNIGQHNRLITNLIYLIEDTADAHELKHLCEDIAQAQRVWRDLLISAEHIGQARAIGTAITAAGNCDSVSRIQLSYLSNKIEETSQRVKNDLEISHQTQHKLQELLYCIKDRVMLDTPQIDSQIYFKLATACLEDMLAKYDEEVMRLRVNIR